MNCEKHLDLIEDLVEDELDEHTAGQVHSHVFACSLCREQYETLKREKEIYAHYLFDAEPPKDLWANFQTQLDAEKEKAVFVNKTPAKTNVSKTNIFGFLRLYPVIASAALFIAFGVGFGWFKFAAIENGDGKYAARPETGASISPPKYASIDESEEKDAVQKIERGGNNIVQKNKNFGDKSESTNAKSAAVANKESVAAEPVKIGRKTIPEVVKNGRKTVPAGALKNPASKNPLNVEERLQSARLRNLEREVAGQIEKVELLLRSFRNARASETIETFDVAYEREQARRLLDKNARLRREAEDYGILYAEELLSRVEPYLLDIANLETNPAPDKVLDIRERVKNQNIIASLQIY
jgi:hypothetical protein